FSEEDISIGSTADERSLLGAVVSACPLVALTRGERGASLYEAGVCSDIGALWLSAEETIELTGAGDTFAAVFVTELASGASAKDAAVSAAFFAALKIKGGYNGRGTASIPTRGEVEHFASENPKRVEAFLTSVGSSRISLLGWELP